MQTIERTTLSELIANEDYARKVLPHMRGDYFSDRSERIVFEEIQKFVEKYNSLPNKTSIEIEIDSRRDLNEQDVKSVIDVVKSLEKDEDANLEWLVETTEKFCKDKAVYNAIVEGIQIIDGKDKHRNVDAIPSILTDALAVGFDNSVGHDYLLDAQSRFEFYHTVEEKIPFDLDFFNRITKGGLPPKTLNIALAGTGVGKSLFMCHMAANCMNQGKNVLYVSMEMAEERIAERIDANLLNIPIDQIENLSKDMFTDKVTTLKAKTEGKLIIKEYPTGQAHTGHFRALLNELKLKKNFVPEMIFIDYLNICASSRMKGMGGAINSYSYIKSIAEEIRGLAVEFNVPIVSATQTTRSGYSNDDVGLEDTSESFGLPATADLMFALISNDELNNVGKILVKQLKNRYNDPTRYNRFTLKIDRSKMRLSDDNDSDDGAKADNVIPVFDQTKTADRFKDFKLDG